MTELSIDDQCFFAVVIFRKHVQGEDSSSVLEQMNPFSVIGSEIMLITPLASRLQQKHINTHQGEVDSMVYFSEINKTFNAASIASRRYTNKTHTAMTIKLSEDEHSSIQRYLVKLTQQNVGYSTASLTIMVVPSMIQSLFYEVPDEKPESFHTLTSTQAVLFALRNCMEANRSVSASLRNIQSRFVSPGRLYDAIEPFSRECNVMSLNIARVVRPKEKILFSGGGN
jgi:hypothetical protein